MPTPQSTSPFRTASDSLLVALFLLAISAPLLGLLLRGESEPKSWENRRYASAPRLEWSLASVSSFPAQLEAYFNDHFALREQLIRWDNVIRTVGLSTSPRPGGGQRLDRRRPGTQQPGPWSSVVLGRDAWFYWFGGEMIEDYRGLRPLGADVLNAWRCSFEERRRELSRRGIPYLLVIVPEKHEIHPEHLPANLRRVGERTRLHEFLAFMRAHSQLEILDLRDPLLAAKGPDPLYYRTGTHWNEYGAYVADRAIAERLATLLPGFSPAPVPPFELRRLGVPGRRMLRTVGISEHFDDLALELVPLDAAGHRDWLSRADHSDLEFGSPSTRGSAPRGAPRALVLNDSFGRTHLDDFLSRHFEHVEFRWTTRLNLALIDSLRPDVVIDERASRFLINLRPETTAAQAQCIREGISIGSPMRVDRRVP
jgi:hypothetical protein